MYPFTRILGNELGKVALILLSINPSIGSMLILGDKGTGKTSLARSLASLEREVVHCPASITDEQLVSGIHLKHSLEQGEVILQEGFLQASDGKIILADDIHLMNEKTFYLLMDGGKYFYHPFCPLKKQGDKVLSYAVVATLNPEETLHLERIKEQFSMVIEAERLAALKERIDIMEAQLEFEKDGEHFYRQAKDELMEISRKIGEAKRRLTEVFIPYPLKQKLVSHLEGSELVGNHWEERLSQVLRASAAWQGREIAYEEDLQLAIKLVLAHRDCPQNSAQKQAPKEKQQEQEPREEQNQKKTFPPPSAVQQGESQRGEAQEEKEEIFAIGKGEIPPLITARKKWKTDFLGVGKKERSITKDFTGRKVRVRTTDKWQDLDLYATLMKASPHQKIRGYQEGKAFVIKERDLQRKVRERGIGNHVILLLDSSGSLAVDRRMSSVKGAVFHLLNEAYVKRDKVALLAFRKKQAQILLPLTRSLSLAKHKLEELPTGGNTPLGLGLSKTLSYIQSIKRKEPQAIFKVYVISDGRTNWSSSNLSPLDEAREYAKQLSQEQISTYYVDYEGGKFPLAFMRELAQLSQGQYYKVDEVTENTLRNVLMR